MGISTDFVPTLQAWSEKMGLTFPLISDLPRSTLEAYGFLDTDPKSRLYRYAKRAYVIIDKGGTVRSMTSRDALARAERSAASPPSCVAGEKLGCGPAGDGKALGCGAGDRAKAGAGID